MNTVKKNIIRYLSIVVVIAIAFSALSCLPASALLNDQSIDVTYQNPTNIIGTQKNEESFIMSTKTKKGKVNNFTFEFPADGGLRFYSDNKGFFGNESLLKIKYSVEGAAIVMKTDELTVKFYKTASPWRFEVYDSKGNYLIYYTADNILMGYDEKGALGKVKIVSPIRKNEKFYGLGERFGGMIQNGKTVEMWNFDSFGQLANPYGDHNVGYKNIPLLHSTSGYSVFHNSTYYGIVDVGDSNAKECSFEFYGPIFDMYLWSGTTVSNIAKYNKLTGSTISVPKWAAEYWAGHSSSVWKSQGDDVDVITNMAKEILDGYDELKTPVKTLFIEGIADSTKYESFMKYLQNRDVRFLGWCFSLFYNYGDEKDAESFLPDVKLKDMPYCKFNYNRTASYWVDNANYWVDVTNPLATLYYKNIFGRFFKYGLSGMMTDYNDAMTTDIYYPYINGTGDYMHNLSCYYYQKTVSDAFESYYGKGNYLNFGRAGCAGSQSFCAAFAGDQGSTFDGLTEVVSALLSSSATGINVWGSDIGGLGSGSDASRYDPDLYTRWLQFATFSPIMRAHGQTGFRDPWNYDTDGSCDKVFQKYYWTRENLVDTIYSAMTRASEENVPVTKAMASAYPYDETLISNETQYLFCENMLVSPITSEDTTYATVQFPRGRWVNLWDGSVHTGGTDETVSATQNEIPVYVSAGAAMPVKLGKDLRIGTINTEDKNVNATLITPALTEKVNKIYVNNDDSYTITSAQTSENNYKVGASRKLDQRIVMALGTNATTVTVDGVSLKKLSSRPDYSATESGYYTDTTNNCTYIVTNGSWKQITFNDNELRKVNLAKSATVAMNGKIPSKLNNINDDDYSSSYSISIDSGSTESIDLDLGENTSDYDEIILYWGSTYPKSYKIQLSTDGNTWKTVKNDQIGKSGTNTVTLSQSTNARYIRVADISKYSKKNPSLNEIEIFGTKVAKQVPKEKKSSDDTVVVRDDDIYEKSTDASDYYTDIDDYNDEDGIEGDNQGSDEDEYEEKTVTKKVRVKVPKKKTADEGIPWWIWIVVIAAVVIVATGTVTFIMIKKKKGKML